jgi:hypothetical protein
MHVCTIYCRLQEYLGLKLAEPLPARMCLAWHPFTEKIAVADTSSIVHVCNAGSAKAKKQLPSAVNLQSEQVLAHDIQQQVQSNAMAMASDTSRVSLYMHLAWWFMKQTALKFSAQAHALLVKNALQTY